MERHFPERGSAAVHEMVLRGGPDPPLPPDHTPPPPPPPPSHEHCGGPGLSITVGCWGGGVPWAGGGAFQPPAQQTSRRNSDPSAGTRGLLWLPPASPRHGLLSEALTPSFIRGSERRAEGLGILFSFNFFLI